MIAPLTPAVHMTGIPREWSLREVVNAILYVMRGGIAWWRLPSDAKANGHIYLDDVRTCSDSVARIVLASSGTKRHSRIGTARAPADWRTKGGKRETWMYRLEEEYPRFLVDAGIRGDRWFVCRCGDD